MKKLQQGMKSSNDQAGYSDEGINFSPVNERSPFYDRLGPSDISLVLLRNTQQT